MLRRLVHHLRGRHAWTWIEIRSGVAHHVCACGWAEPARSLGPRAIRRQSYDYTKAVRSRGLADTLERDWRRLARRRLEPLVPDATIDAAGNVRRFDDRRSVR